MMRPPAIFCIGRNYADHAKEMNATPPERPTVFMKNPASVIGSGETIRIPTICQEHGPQVDFEGELAVIMGEDCRDITAEQASNYIDGYAVANDVSARWWQKQGAGGQWIRGKSFDTFCPMTEPVPSDGIDPQTLHVHTTVSGTRMQDGNTAEMIFPVVDLIAELSRGTTLLKGTVILTGTPAGVGAARNPPRFLETGDVVEVHIAGIGTLTNPVQAD